MTILDPIGDMLTRIRNGQHVRKSTVSVPASNMKKNILEVLVREGYIRGYTEDKDAKGHPSFSVELKYVEGDAVISNIQRVSTPGLRVYKAIGDVKPIANGLGINILSTSKGIMSDAEALKSRVGGEVICSVF